MMPFHAPPPLLSSRGEREIRPPLVVEIPDPQQQQQQHARPLPLRQYHIHHEHHQNHPQQPHQHQHLTATSNAVSDMIMNPYQQVQEMFHAISRTVPQIQRHQVLENTLQLLSHEDVALHDYEVDHGLDRALCLQLGYLDTVISTSSPMSNANTNNNSNNQQQQQSHHQIEKEQTLICWCLTRIYKCSRERRLRSFREMGGSDLLPILVKILKRYTTTSFFNFNIVYPILMLLRIFAKLDSHTKTSLLHWKNGRLLDVLVHLLQPQEQTPSDHDPTTIYSQQPVVVAEAFGFLKDISFRLQDNDKELMYTKLSAFLIQSTNDNVADTTITMDVSLKEKRLESLSAMYWNFATSSRISLDMGHSPAALNSLGQLLQYHIGGTSSDGVEAAAKIKKNAVSAFGNIVVALTARGPILTVTDQNCPTKRENGDATILAMLQQQDWILPTLFQLLSGETDQDIQRRAMRTIRCLASCSWGRTLLLKGEKIPTSCSAASGARELSSHLFMVLDKNSSFDVSTRIQVCETIGYLSQDPIVMAVIGQDLERILLQTIEHSHSTQHLEKEQQANLIASSCKALRLIWERCTWGQARPIPPSISFFASLLACSKMDPEITHPPVAKLLLKIGQKFLMPSDTELSSGANAGLQDSQGDVDKVGCDFSSNILSKPLFDTLSELLQPVGPCFDESRQDTLDLLHLFLQNDANKRVLAEHEGLLTALVGFALMTSQNDKKKRAKGMILQLVPEL